MIRTETIVYAKLRLIWHLSVISTPIFHDKTGNFAPFLCHWQFRVDIIFWNKPSNYEIISIWIQLLRFQPVHIFWCIICQLALFGICTIRNKGSLQITSLDTLSVITFMNIFFYINKIARSLCLTIICLDIFQYFRKGTLHFALIHSYPSGFKKLFFQVCGSSSENVPQTARFYTPKYTMAFLCGYSLYI